MANYNKCPNGHYYDASLDACPYCSSRGTSSSAGQGDKTNPYEDFVGGNAGNNGGATAPYEDGGYNGGYNGGYDGGTMPGGFSPDDQRTMPYGGADGPENMNGDNYGETIDVNEMGRKKNNNENIQLDAAERTVFFDEEEHTINGQQAKVVSERSRRKLVGWLVTYSLDAMGVDYRLYEGKNIIGRDPRVQITIPDPAISNTHATIRYLKGKFAIKDEMSSHGTSVNDKDIELGAVYLNDGDLIQIGHTTLKFRIAL